MSIHSRNIGSSQPSGNYLEVTEDELKYISALLAMTSLGAGTTSSDAAYELIQKIVVMTGSSDFIIDALEEVDPRFVISTSSGVLEYSSSFVTIDV